MSDNAPLQFIAREVGRSAARLRNGIRYAAGTQFAPIGPTPSRVVWQEGKAQLRHYHRTGSAPPRLGPPAIVLGGLVGRSYIFDLHEGNSFVARMLDAGFDTFVLDWGIPDADDSANTLETYLARYFPRALRAALRETGADEVSVVGYCMGGSMSLQALAANPTLPVRNLVLIATPVDFRHLGAMVDAVAQRRLDPASVLDQDGNVPASLIAAFFSVMKPTAPVVKYANLWQNLWNEDYLRGYQALNRCFEQHSPLPGAAFLQIAEQWMQSNGFVSDSLRLDGRAVHLADLTMPVLVVTGDRDELVPAGATAPVADLLTGTKPQVLSLSAGHASLTTGRTAAKVTVPRILGWLADRSDPTHKGVTRF